MSNEQLVSINKVVSLLTEHGCVGSLLDSTDDKAKGFALALTSGVATYDLRNSSPTGQKQQLLLKYMVSIGAVNAEFEAAVLEEANPAPVNEPEPAPVVYTTATVKWCYGQDLVIDLQEELPEPVTATLWLVEEGYQDENLGRPCRLKEKLKYRIRMDGKRCNGDVEVRIPKENCLFNVEVI
jgi:hypothetical protein